MRRRLHLAGSADKHNSDPDLLSYTHDAIREFVRIYAADGGTFVTGLPGPEPLREGLDVPCTFDWTVVETLAACLDDGSVEPRVRGEPLLMVRTSRTAYDRIEEHRRAQLQTLKDADAVDLKFLPDTWRSGALMRQAQAEVGEALITFSGGAGVEHLVNLYVGTGRHVIAVDVDLGCWSNDAVMGGTKLARKALTDASLFARLEDQAIPLETRLTSLVIEAGRSTPTEYAERLARLVADLARPEVFCVRLLDQGHEDYEYVQAFLTKVAKPALEQAGYRMVDLGVDQQQHAFMNEEVFKRLHFSERVLCDLTGLRPNCTTEMGYALGQQKPVVITAKEGTFKPFDLDKLPWHMWQPGGEGDEAVDRLCQHIDQFLGRAPLVSPITFV